MALADVGDIFNAIWWGFIGFFWNWFFFVLVLVGIVLVVLFLIKVTANVLTWLFGFTLVKIVASIFLAILVIGMIFSAIGSGVQAYGNSGYNPITGGGNSSTNTGNCQPASVEAFPPDNPQDAIQMLCATNVAQVHRIVDDYYDGVQLVAPPNQTMSAILPANMCIIYIQTAQTSFDQSEMTILRSETDSQKDTIVHARTKAVVSFTNRVGLSAYGTPC